MTSPSNEPAKTSPSADQHLKALSAFAARQQLPSDVSRLSELAAIAIPLIDQFLEGGPTDELRQELKDVLPSIAGCLRGLTAELEELKSTPPFLSAGAGWSLRSMLHSGAHIEAAIWGLSPDLPEAVEATETKDSDKTWEDLLEHNLEQGRLTLLQAAKVEETWREAQRQSERITNRLN